MTPHPRLDLPRPSRRGVLAEDPNLGIEEARATIATAVGILVGHDGPLPAPAAFEGGAAG